MYGLRRMAVASRWASVARSVPSKLQHCHSTLGHSPHILFPVIPPLYATYPHRNPIGTSSESHRNLIGTSPSDERIIKQSSPRLEQLFFDIIIQPRRHSRFAILWHTLMFACLTQCGTMFLCPCFALHRVT